MRRLSYLLLSLVLLCALEGAAQPSQPVWLREDAELFNLFYQAEDSLNAQQLARTLREELPAMRAELGAASDTPISLFIAPTRRLFDQLTGGAIPQWGEAVADPQKRVIVFKSPRWSTSQGKWRTTIIHELVHVLVGEIVGPALVPHWLTEGLAVYFSGDVAYIGGEELSKAQLSDQLIPLTKIDKMLEFGRMKAHLAYQESYLAVVYILETYGNTALHALLEALRKRGRIDPALREAFGVSLLQFEREWQHYLRKKYSWSFLVDFESYLWVLILLLFFLAVLAVAVRKRRTIARWEDEQHAPPPPPTDEI